MPPDTQVEEDWRALVIPGPIPFESTGVLSALATPLADAGIPIFAISTYDTDYVLVRAQNLERALEVLGVKPLRRRITSGSPYESVIGFSRAVRVGDRVLVSGTGPVMPDGGCPRVHAASRPGAAGRSSWPRWPRPAPRADDVVRTRTLLTPAADAEGAMTAHGEVFADVRPASTMLVIHSLLDPRWTVEVEAEAQLD